MIVVDASVLIGHLSSRDAHHVRATQLLLELADESLGASVVTSRRARRATGSRLAGTGPTRTSASVCCALMAAENRDGALATFDNRLAAAALDRGLDVRR